MYCPYCGSKNGDYSSFCMSCGKRLPQHAGQLTVSYGKSQKPSPILKTITIIVVVFTIFVFIYLFALKNNGIKTGDQTRISLEQNAYLSDSNSSQSSPINVVKSVIQARANSDWQQFSQLVIDGEEQYIWDGIVNCEGKNPNFQYEENIGKNLSGTVDVWNLDDQSDVGDIDVKKLGDKWYVIGYWGGYYTHFYCDHNFD